MTPEQVQELIDAAIKKERERLKEIIKEADDWYQDEDSSKYAYRMFDRLIRDLNKDD